MSDALPQIRKTKQRTSVLMSLGKMSTFQSAQEIYAVLKQENQSIGLTTVYRTLASLAEQGEIDRIRRADGEMVYRH
ncbi:MAG: transcriptional repressor, partial [Actinobacteria bacterium]|nr:transcriptional repressor [Actinomycetota bacterium]